MNECADSHLLQTEICAGHYASWDVANSIIFLHWERTVARMAQIIHTAQEIPFFQKRKKWGVKNHKQKGEKI